MLFAGRNGASSTEKQAGGYVPLTLDICKWSTLGCYLLLEAFTIVSLHGSPFLMVLLNYGTTSSLDKMVHTILNSFRPYPGTQT